MPGGDRTGPAGQGPMTGRAAGFCAGNPTPGYVNGGGFFRGARRGGGGRRNWYYSAYPAGFNREPMVGIARDLAADTTGSQQELAALKQQTENLKGILSELQRRVDAMEATGG